MAKHLNLFSNLRGVSLRSFVCIGLFVFVFSIGPSRNQAFSQSAPLVGTPTEKIRTSRGWIELKNPLVKAPNSISVAAGVQGVIETLQAREGDIRGPGTPIAKVRCDEAEMLVKRTELSLQIATLKSERKVDLLFAKKSAEVANQELARTLRANELAADTYPPVEVDRYRLLAERAALEIERAEVDMQLNRLNRDSIAVELAQAKRAVDRHIITAQEEAVVIDVFKNVGEWVEPSDKIIEIISIKKLRIEGLLESAQAESVRRGSHAEVIIADSKVPATKATVSFVSPIENPVNRQVKVFVDLENSRQAFRPGMAIQVRIEVE
jgi:multidrug efflux pump subunit AcrA (membrane-fusion protein)